MTPQDVRSILKEAVALVEELKIPEDLRSQAFKEIIRLLTPSATHAPGMHETSDEKTEHLGLHAQLAKRLKVDVDLVNDNYTVSDGALKVAVPQSRLPSTKAAATRDLALLVAAGEQFASADTSTAVKTIRDVCDEYSRLDSPNFSKHLQGGDSFWHIKNGQLKLRIPGWDEAARVLKGMETNKN